VLKYHVRRPALCIKRFQAANSTVPLRLPHRQFLSHGDYTMQRHSKYGRCCASGKLTAQAIAAAPEANSPNRLEHKTSSLQRMLQLLSPVHEKAGLWRMPTNFVAKSRQSIPRLYLGTLLMSAAKLFGPFMFGAAALMNWWMAGAELTTPETLDRWGSSARITVCGSPIRRPGCSFGRYARALPIGYSALSGYDCRSADGLVPELRDV